MKNDEVGSMNYEVGTMNESAIWAAADVFHTTDFSSLSIWTVVSAVSVVSAQSVFQPTQNVR